LVHIDLREFASNLDSNQIIALANAGVPGFLFVDSFGPLTSPWIDRQGSAAGPILTVNSPLINLGRFIVTSWDFEEVYTLDTSRLGHGDWGTLTETLNWTYLADVDIQFLPNGKRHTVVGQFGGGFQGPGGFSSFPHNKFYASLFYDGPSATWMQGLDAGAIVHYIGQYNDSEGDTFLGANGREGLPTANGVIDADRKIREWATVDLIFNYTFNLPPPVAQTEVAGYAKDGGKNVKMKDGKEKNVMPVSTAEYNPCGWRAWLNNTTITLGVDNVFDLEPPFVAGSLEGGDVPGYDAAQANMKGRLWFAAIKKRF
jgi:hypothetical protein